MLAALAGLVEVDVIVFSLFFFFFFFPNHLDNY